MKVHGAEIWTIRRQTRVSFLVGPEGKFVHVTNSGNPRVHHEEMKSAIAGMKKQFDRRAELCEAPNSAIRKQLGLAGLGSP